MARLSLLFALLGFASVAALLAPLQLLSDDWSHLQTVSSFGSWRDAFDPGLNPLRPAQWLWFYVIVSPDDLVATRLPAIALSGVGLGLTYAVCRSLGGSPRAASLAVLLFALYPNTSSLAWPAAIGWLGRHVGLLLGLLAYVHHLRRPRTLTAAGVLAGQLLALTFHQAAVVLPVLCAAHAISIEGRRAFARRLRDPVTWLLVGVVLPYVVYVALLRPERSASGVPLSSLPSSVFRAVTVLWPSSVRHLLEDGFRTGGLALAAAAPLVLCVPAIGVLAICRGGPARFLGLAIGIELTFSTLASGFLPRYALTASALWAIGLGLWAGERGGRIRITLLLLVAAAYAAGTVQSLRRSYDADAAVTAIREAVVRADAEARPDAVLVLVDVPGELDRDLSVPLFRYGLRHALHHWGIERPMRAWSVDVERGPMPEHRATEAEVETAVRDPQRVVLRFDPAALVLRRPAEPPR